MNREELNNTIREYREMLRKEYGENNAPLHNIPLGLVIKTCSGKPATFVGIRDNVYPEHWMFVVEGFLSIFHYDEWGILDDCKGDDFVQKYSLDINDLFKKRHKKYIRNYPHN